MDILQLKDLPKNINASLLNVLSKRGFLTDENIDVVIRIAYNYYNYIYTVAEVVIITVICILKILKASERTNQSVRA